MKHQKVADEDVILFPATRSPSQLEELKSLPAMIIERGNGLSRREAAIAIRKIFGLIRVFGRQRKTAKNGLSHAC